MRLDKFIEMLKEYPGECEVYCNHPRLDNEVQVFKISKENDAVIIQAPPFSLEDALYDKEFEENTQFNVDDTFELYSKDTGDVVEYKHDEYNATYKNKYKDGDSFDEYQRYSEPDLGFVGGLRRFLSAFDDDMRINIKAGEGYAGVIHEIHKAEVCYLTGTYDYVDEECEDELFLIYGVPVSPFDGGGSFPLKDNTPWGWNNEINRVIAKPIIDYFTNDGEKPLKEAITDQEGKDWGEVVEAIKKNLFQYYRFTYRLNGSWDSNGYFHPYDKNELYKKPPIKKEEADEEAG